MKRLCGIVVAWMLGMLLSSYAVDAQLKNASYGHTLYLYKDGTCVVRTVDGRGAGTYDIQGTKIYLKWDNGVSQQGTIEKREGQVASVSIEGVTYSRKLVVKRS